MSRTIVASIGAALTLVACEIEVRMPSSTAVSEESTAASHAVALDRLSSKRIFFAHQSVGGNILEGVRELASETPGVRLAVVNSKSPETVNEPALIEASLGENGNPASKVSAFAAALDRGLGDAGGIALVKLCYLDIQPGSDPVALFEDYRARMDSIAARYPELTLVHVTMPLTAAEPAPKHLVKKLLGRPTAADLNAKRNAYNRQLRATYEGKAPVFDLARLESIGRNGRPVTTGHADGDVPVLAPEWTDDGGHLNAAGRRMVAREFVELLSKL